MDFSTNTNELSPINDSGQVAFYGTVSSGTNGIFLGTSGGTSLIALTGQTVSGPTLTSLNGCSNCGWDVNSSGQVAFGASNSTGSGLYVGTANGTPLKIVSSTDPRPSPQSGTFGTLNPISAFSDNGQILFQALNGGGIYSGSTGGVTTIVADGAANPGTGGGNLLTTTPGNSSGSFSSFFSTTNAAFDSCGDIGFVSRVVGATGGIPNSGYFGLFGGCSGPLGPLQAVALQGETVTGVGTLGTIFPSFPNAQFFIVNSNHGNSNTIGFTNSFTNTNGVTMIGQFLAAPGGGIEKVLAPGDPIFGTGGGVYANATISTQNNNNTPLALVVTTGGTATQAIVIVQPPSGTVATSTALVSSSSTVGVGVPVTFTATVTSSPAPQAQDVVAFADNGVLLGLGFISGNVATFTTSTLPPGTHSISAEFLSGTGSGSGNETLESSASNVVTQIVSNATTSLLFSTQNPSSPNTPVVFEAIVFPTLGANVLPTGTVTFFDGASQIGSPVALSSELAIFTSPALAAGTHNITGQYSGDANFAATTSSPVVQVVQSSALLPSATALASSVNPSFAGESVTFIAPVDGPTGGTPTGTVNFLDNGVMIGSGAISSGQAMFTTSTILAGTHAITAVYPGNASFSSSTSNIVMQVVSPALLTSITVTPNNASTSIPLGTTLQFIATGHYSDNTTANLTTLANWNSSNPGVASVSNTAGTQGVATGVGLGGVNITASFNGVISTPVAPLTVTGAVAQSIVVVPATASVVIGNTQPFAALATFTDGTLVDITPLVTWHSSQTGFATINGSGVATGVNAGPTAITAQLGAVTSSSATLTVTSVTLVSIAVTPINPFTMPTTNQPFTATGTYSDNSVADLTSRVTWLSSAPNIATIDSSGAAVTTFATSGSTTISATLGAVSKSTTLTLTTTPVVPASFHLDFYGNSGLQTGVIDNLFNYSNTFLGSFQVAATALGTPKNLYLYRDPAFLAFDAPFSTNFNNYDFNLNNGDSIYFPGDQYPFADGTNTDPVQGLRLDTSGNPLRFDTPSTLSGTTAVIRDFPSQNTPGPELTLADGDSFAYSVLNDGTLLQTSTLDGQSPSQSVGGTWSFNGGPNDNTLYSGIYLITPVEAITSANNATFHVGALGSFTVKTVGSPLYPPSLFQSGNLPNGVSFLDNGDGTGTLSGNPPVGSAGTYNITFRANNGNSIDVDPDVTQNFTLTVIASPLTATNTALTSLQNPSSFGQSVTFKATVTDSAEVTPTGTVNFIDNTTDATIGTGTLSGGTATFTTSSLSATTSHVITAQYLGDGLNFASSLSNSVTQVVNPVHNPSSTIITSSLNPSAIGQSVVLTAVVFSTSGGTPTGTVTFLDGTSPIGTGALTAAGQATFTTSTLGLGSHSLTAMYSGDSGFVSSTSSALTQTINQAPTVTTVNSSLNPSGSGQAVQFTVIVTSSTGLVPTGNVTLSIDGSAFGSPTALNANGVATFTTSGLAVGSHSVLAGYPSGAMFIGSTSTGLTQMVAPNTTTTSLNSALNPSSSTQSVQFTASVTSSGGGIPTGTVNFLDNNVLIGSGTLSNGVATFRTSTLSVATHPITAQYVGNASFGSSTSGTLVQTVTVSPTSTSVVSSLNPASFAQSVTFTAIVLATGGGGTPTGSVTFLDNTAEVTLGTVNLTAGQAAFTTSSLALGSHSIVAVYSGDSNFVGSTSSVVSQTINHGPTSTAVASSLNPSAGGQIVQFSAIVTSSTGQTPAGTVTFFDGSASIGTGNLNGNGVATFSTSALGVGPHSITAQYPSGAMFNGSTSAVLTQTVTLNPTSTALITSLNPSPSTDFVQFSAIVTSSAGVTPTGTVNFLDNSVTPAIQIGTSALNASGVATYGTSTLSIGTHSITAQYLGTASFGGSTSATLNQSVTINPTPTTIPTTIAISSLPNPSSVGQAVVLTATVTTSSSTSGTPTGHVTFLDGGAPIANGLIQLATGSATAVFSTSTLTAGSHPITAQYSGDANFALSLSPVVNQTVGSNTQVTVQITPIPTNVAPQSSCSQGGYCQTFTVAIQNGGTAPSVTWQVLSGPGSIDSNGNYTAGPTVTQGPVTISASVGNSSASVSFTLGPDALTTPGTQTNSTVNAGTPFTVPIMLTGIPATSTVPFTLSCGSLPAASTCKFTNTSATPAGCPMGTITFVTGTCPNFMVTVTTSGGTLSGRMSPTPAGSGRPWSGRPLYGLLAILLSILTLAGLTLAGRRRSPFLGRTSYACCVLVLLSLSVMFLASCSVFPAQQTVSAPVASPLTPSGSYQVVVLATPPGGTNGGGFVQTQLIVPLVVN